MCELKLMGNKFYLKLEHRCIKDIVNQQAIQTYIGSKVYSNKGPSIMHKHALYEKWNSVLENKTDEKSDF